MPAPPAPPAPPDPSDGRDRRGDAAADPVAVEALDHLRRLVAGRASPRVGPAPPPSADDGPVPDWVTIADRARVRWLRVPPGARFAAGAVALVGAGAVGWWALRPPPVPAERTLPRVEEVAPVPPPTTVPTTVVVHAAGAVAAPGVRSLPTGSRVADLLEASGGALPGADLDRLNLAAPLVDGARVHVPLVGEPSVAAVPVAGAGSDDGPPAPIDLNAADAGTLESLPGVGPTTAAAIVAHRDAQGSFGSVDDLLDVDGIGPAKLESIRPLVVVSG